MSEIHLGDGQPPPSSSPSPPGGPRRPKLLPMLLGALFWPLGFFAFAGAPACMGFEDPTLRAIEGCPRAVEILGTPVTRSWWGLSCGNAESGDDTGNASWRFPVAGPRGSGSVDVYAVQRGGPWTIQSATLEAGGSTLDVVSCTEGGPLAIAPTTRRATVTQVIGSPGVEQGGTCEVSITPVDADAFNCRIAIRCGAVSLYGATDSTGYARCGTDAQRGLVARDEDPTPSGGDPTLDLRLGQGEVILTDQTASGTWVVSMHVEPE